MDAALDASWMLAALQVVSGNIKKLPKDLAGALGAMEKPYTMNGMANALAFIDAVVRGDESRLPPASLVLAEDAYQKTH